MRKWWLVLLLVAIAVVVSRSSVLPSPLLVSHQVKINSSVAVVSKPELHPPRVSSKQLFAHIKALNYKRYTESERDRTRDYLIASLKKWGWLPKLQSFEGGVNILAERKGTAPEAGRVLVAAHYDTVAVSPGADDNNTGVAVVLELARIFSSHPTPLTLQLAFFDQEERGLRGSVAFVTNEPNLENLRGVIVMDMIGFACYTAGCQRYPEGLPVTPPTNRGDFLAVVGDSEHLPLLSTFAKSSQPGLPSVLTLPVPFKGMLTPDTLRSDHAPFWYQGIGAVLVSDTANLRTPHYHKPSDKPPTLDRAFFNGSAQVVVNATTALLKG